MNRTPLRHKLLATAEEFQLTPGLGAKFGDFRRTDEAAEATGKPRWPSASECRTLRALWEENLLTRVPKVRAFATSPIKLTGGGRRLLAEWDAKHGKQTP